MSGKFMLVLAGYSTILVFGVNLATAELQGEKREERRMRRDAGTAHHQISLMTRLTATLFFINPNCL
jgi:hypothetical protein